MKKPSPLTIAEFVCLGGVIAFAIAGAIIPAVESPHRNIFLIPAFVLCLSGLL